jgi:hypothetical protein
MFSRDEDGMNLEALPRLQGALLIRYWRDGRRWRFVLESIGQVRQKRTFSTLAELTQYLQQLHEEMAGSE